MFPAGFIRNGVTIDLRMLLVFVRIFEYLDTVPVILESEIYPDSDSILKHDIQYYDVNYQN